MKRTPWLVGGLSVLVCGVSWLDAAPVASEISSVTVYADRARLSRSGKVTLPAGESEWTFERLPAGVIDESVQAAGRGLPGVTILDVSTKVAHATAAVDPRIKELETAIEGLDRRLRGLDDKTKALEKQAELLEKIENAVAAPPTEKSGPRPGYDEWTKLLSFSDETRQKLAASALGIEDERKQVLAERQAKQADLDQVRHGLSAGRAYKEVTVRLSASQAGEVELGLSYAEWGASWAPSYDARLNTGTRQLELSYFGTVRQNTGEDWNKVALVLSTAKPSLGGAAPQLSPWVVDVFTRPEPSATVMGPNADEVVQLSPFSVSKGGKDKDYKAAQSMAGARVRGQEGAQSNAGYGIGLLRDAANIETGGVQGNFAYNAASLQNAATSASFSIASVTTVKSDNTPQRVAIAGGVLPAKLRFETAPRLQETAFLTAEVQNLTDYPFLGGPVSVFLDDSFVTNSFLKSVMPGEKFEVAMGADEGIAVKRRVVSRFAEDTGLTGGGRRVTYEFLVTLTNNKKSGETVLLRDVVPVSRNEKITVKVVTPGEKEFSTKDKPKEITREEDGKLLWTLALKAGEKREVPLKIVVEYPGDVPVTGVE